ncbi:ketosynthase [Pseudoxanthomonas daejeonensis]
MKAGPAASDRRDPDRPDPDNREPESRGAAAPAELADKAALPVQLVLGVAYPFLAHLAGTRGGAWTALALADLAVLMLAAPLLRRRWWALALLAAVLAGLSWWVGTLWLDLLLLAPPVLFTAWLAWWFARSLVATRTPLVTRIVCALYAQAGWETPPGLLAYARRLTAAWALLLAFLAVANALLALWAVPGGVLDAFGRTPWIAVPHWAWSWFANLLNYGLVGGFMVAEFNYRKRHFPVRPYRNGVDFARKMAALGPAFWRDLLN